MTVTPTPSWSVTSGPRHKNNSIDHASQPPTRTTRRLRRCSERLRGGSGLPRSQQKAPRTLQIPNLKFSIPSFRRMKILHPHASFHIRSNVSVSDACKSWKETTLLYPLIVGGSLAGSPFRCTFNGPTTKQQPSSTVALHTHRGKLHSVAHVCNGDSGRRIRGKNYFA